MVSRKIAASGAAGKFADPPKAQLEDAVDHLFDDLTSDPSQQAANDPGTAPASILAPPDNQVNRIQSPGRRLPADPDTQSASTSATRAIVDLTARAQSEADDADAELMEGDPFAPKQVQPRVSPSDALRADVLPLHDRDTLIEVETPSMATETVSRESRSENSVMRLLGQRRSKTEMTMLVVITVLLAWIAISLMVIAVKLSLGASLSRGTRDESSAVAASASNDPYRVEAAGPGDAAARALVAGGAADAQPPQAKPASDHAAVPDDDQVPAQVADEARDAAIVGDDLDADSPMDDGEGDRAAALDAADTRADEELDLAEDPAMIDEDEGQTAVADDEIDDSATQLVRLDNPTVRPYFKKVRKSLTRCGRQSRVRGQVKVSLTIDETGMATAARVHSGPQQFRRCVVRLLRSVDYPRSKRGGQLRLPIWFSGQ